MSLLTVIAVGVGAGLGAQLRHAAEQLERRARARRGDAGPGFPWATFAVNALGSGGLGVLVGLHSAGVVGPTWFALGGAGVCGGLTTFSTLALDVVRLVRARSSLVAGYVAAQVVTGLGLFVAGLALVG